MSKGRWRKLFAIGGLALALSACGLSTPIEQHFNRQAHDASYSERCNEEQKSTDNDLCQQWRMAVAAENLLFVSSAQTVILIAALVFSIWAAWASSRQAKASEEQLRSTESAHLLVHFDDTGIDQTPIYGGKDVVRATEWMLHNYSDKVAYIRWRYARHAYLPEPEIPEPLDWQSHVGGHVPHGVIAAPESDSETFKTDPADSVTAADKAQIGDNGRWFFQGFVAYTDNTIGLHILLFTYMIDDGEWRILSTGSVHDDGKYNDNKRRDRIDKIRIWRRKLARWLRRTAVFVEPRPPK